MTRHRWRHGGSREHAKPSLQCQMLTRPRHQPIDCACRHWPNRCHRRLYKPTSRQHLHYLHPHHALRHHYRRSQPAQLRRIAPMAAPRLITSYQARRKHPSPAVRRFRRSPPTIRLARGLQRDSSLHCRPRRACIGCRRFSPTLIDQIECILFPQSTPHRTAHHRARPRSCIRCGIVPACNQCRRHRYRHRPARSSSLQRRT